MFERPLRLVQRRVVHLDGTAVAVVGIPDRMRPAAADAVGPITAITAITAITRSGSRC